MKTKFVIALFILLVMSSCGLTKKSQTEDKSTETTETERKVITREPSKVVSETKYNVKYKDTTITTVNYETKTILRETYDNQGNRTTECECEGIREEVENIKSVLKKDIETRKETEVKIDLSPLIWAIVGLAGMILLIAIVGLIAFIHLKKSIPEIISKSISP